MKKLKLQQHSANKGCRKSTLKPFEIKFVFTAWFLFRRGYGSNHVWKGSSGSNFIDVTSENWNNS